MTKIFAAPTALIIAIGLLASCTAPDSADGVSRSLVVQNQGSVPLISLYVGKPGTTPMSKPLPTEFTLALPDQGHIDLLPIRNLQPGETKAFNVDDGEGTCVFEVAFQFLDGFKGAVPELDVCAGYALTPSN